MFTLASGMKVLISQHPHQHRDLVIVVHLLCEKWYLTVNLLYCIPLIWGLKLRIIFICLRTISSIFYSELSK